MRCVTCKGRGLCGRPACPILRRLEEIAALPRIGERLEGLSPPEVFVGRHGYPLVRAGPMVPVGDLRRPALGMDIGEIIASRSAMVRSEARISVREADAPGRLLEACQQMAMSSAPVGAEVSFSRPPQGRAQFDGVLAPSGPSAELKSLEITTNPVIPRRVDQAVEERGVAAAEAAVELYSSGIETEHISRMLSLGLLGRRRRLVPTRWSITAADDMIGRHLKEAILEMPLLDCLQLFSWEELGNHFEILLLPGSFSFELIEIWMPRSLWAEEGFIGADREDTRERRRYSPLAGGYYAARLAALEHLAGARRQASVLALREISEAYWAPLGVWVVREVARKALCTPPARPEGLKEAVEEIGRRIRTPVARWLHLSETLAGPRQKRLADFL